MRKRLGTGREGASRTAAKTAVLPLEGAPRRSGTQDRLTHGFNASRALAAVLAVVAGVLLALPAEASRGGNPGLDLQAFSKPPELLSSVAQSSVAPRRSGEAIRFRLDGGVPRSLSESLEEAFVIVDLPEFEPAGIGAHELVELAPAGRTFEPRFERSILEGLGDRVTLGAKPPPCNGLCIYAWEERSTYSLRARWYDPRTAQFLSEDPLDDIDSPNVYGYVAGRPHEARDPWGLCVLGIPCPKPVQKVLDRAADATVETTQRSIDSVTKAYSDSTRAVGGAYRQMGEEALWFAGTTLGTLQRADKVIHDPNASPEEKKRESAAQGKVMLGAVMLFEGVRTPLPSNAAGGGVGAAGPSVRAIRLGIGSTSMDAEVLRRVGKMIAENPVAARAYAQMQKHGTQVVLEVTGAPNSATRAEYFINQNLVKVYLENNETLTEVVSSIVHESSHVNRVFRKSFSITRYEEFKALSREKLYEKSLQPSDPAAPIRLRPTEGERLRLNVDTNRMYPHLPKGPKP